MAFWKNFFKTKLIENVEIVFHKNGLSEDDKLDNLIVGDLSGGFDGMVLADMYNDENSAETTFKITYDDGSFEFITTQDGSKKYNYYINFVD